MTNSRHSPNIFEDEEAARHWVHSSFDNQGTVVPSDVRDKLHLRGLVPSGIDSFENQEERAMEQLRLKKTDLEKYMFLAWLKNTNLQLFYRMLLDNLEEITPLIYTPTVGSACLQYSHILPFLAPPGQPDGLFISLKDLDNLDELFRNYIEALPEPELTPQITVITDGSRILGLGDLGVNGMGIPVGKLQLYVAAAGLDPRRTLPICLDFGTNTDRFLEDKLYLGLRQQRPDDEQFFAAVDKVMKALTRHFPNIFIQFEDFSSEHAFDLLSKYRDDYFCFNDDIQGTGAVILSGFINAVKQAPVDPREHRILFHGAGSAGVGVAKQLMDYFVIEHGYSEEEAKKKFWLSDSKGLITKDRGDRLAQHKVFFAREDNDGRQSKSLLETIDYVKPTALIGLCAQSGVFDEAVLKRMAELNERPIVFPLSNPLDNAECTFASAMKHTDNRVIFASGTAFPSYQVPGTDEIRVPGQGNNMYIFPGLGLGATLAKPKCITDTMIYAAAKSLAGSLNDDEKAHNLLYPRLTRIREVSVDVAEAICTQALKDGVAKDDVVRRLKTPEALREHARENMWEPTRKTEDIVHSNL
ncbi:hypothetical protein IWQ60_008062 [Tieghemiomyces parasiticus]|uniref:Malic enzyme n=1 Tax=Tieghemiomyces parasiticus TaxID=78921 RepID=A0A9W7ZZQ2_9FUNG|nr:hypothetical protein IWQ60_008062 [Tieghemiomyces parasiticus]